MFMHRQCKWFVAVDANSLSRAHKLRERLTQEIAFGGSRSEGDYALLATLSRRLGRGNLGVPCFVVGMREGASGACILKFIDSSSGTL